MEKDAKPFTNIKSLIKSFGGDEKLTKKRYKKRRSGGREPENSVHDNTGNEKNAVMMIDILMLPTAQFGFKYLLVATDIITRAFDIQPMKNKDADTVLKAFKTMTSRKYIKVPEYYLISDKGSEFKGEFDKYLYDHNIFHKETEKGRHSQLANVDSLIAVLGRIFTAYMNKKEAETGKVSKNWTEIVDIVRDKLNEIRTVKDKDLEEKEVPLVETTVSKVVKKGKKEIIEREFKKPKFKVGQNVYRLLENPENMLSKVQYGKMREGDVRIEREPRKIVQLVYMNGQGPFVRYILEGIPNVSYEESELRTRL
jgi:hypothetical protein